MNDNKAVIAAISAAVQAYMDQENGRQAKTKLNLWKLQGFQDSMNIRQMWQQRVGVYAGSPVNRRAFPLLNSQQH